MLKRGCVFSHACTGGLRGVLVVVVAPVSLGFLEAGGLGGMLGAPGEEELLGGSGARRTGWRGAKVSWETLGLEPGGPREGDEERGRGGGREGGRGGGDGGGEGRKWMV